MSNSNEIKEEKFVCILSQDDTAKKICENIIALCKNKETRLCFIKKQFDNISREEDDNIKEIFFELFNYLKCKGKIKEECNFDEWQILFELERDFVVIRR